MSLPIRSPSIDSMEEHRQVARHEFSLTVSALLRAVTSGQNLYNNPAINLAPFLYMDDENDKRWKAGHSGDEYYLGRDEEATHAIAMNDPHFDRVRVENYFDLGSVRSISESTGMKFSARNWFFFERAPGLAINAAKNIHETLNVNVRAIICDFFKPLPLMRSNTAITLTGGLIQNVEPHDDVSQLQHRLVQIFGNYATAVSWTKSSAVKNHMIVGFDASKDDAQIVACYDTQPFASLVRSVCGRAFDTEGFNYRVSFERKKGIGLLTAGLMASRDIVMPFHGEVFRLKEGQFMPVVCSNRMPVPYVTRAAEKAGWHHEKTWSATGRSHYQHYTI